MSDFIVRRFQKEDAEEVAALIRKTLQISNTKDYSSESIDVLVKQHTSEHVIERAGWTHFYVVCDGNIIIGCGAIGSYWGKEDESSLFTIFVLPEYQHMGYGRQLLRFAEERIADTYAEIELHSSLPAKCIYLNRGYKFIEAHQITTENGDVLCYDLLKKKIDSEK